MTKLINKNGVLKYAEIWRDGAEVTIHTGIVGERGTEQVLRVEDDSSYDKLHEQFITKYIEQGFEILRDKDLTELAVQYKIKGSGNQNDLKKRYEIEDLLNDILGWTGNGHCDGGDIGGGTINIYCFVVSPEIAISSIIKELGDNKLIAGAVIAQVIEDEYKAIFPANADYF
jgi:hypothetical protein